MTVANVEMAAAWDGDEGDHWTENAQRYEGTGRWISARFAAEKLVASDDSVLDIGCGTGRSTRDAGRAAPSGSALGVDLSSRMLEYARAQARAEGLTNIEFIQADAQVHPFRPGAFDVAISSFGAMFFADPIAAFTNVAGGLRPGGRLALLAWQALGRNEWLTAIRSALDAGRSLPEPPSGVPGPFGLADPASVRDILGSAGLVDVDLASVEEPVFLGADADDAWAFVSGMGIVRGLSHDLGEAMRQEALERLREVVDEHETPEGVLFASAAWLITARRP